MAEKQSSVVLNFKTNGQIQYAKTIKDINAIMNAAAKEYRSQIKIMGEDATATDKLRAEKKKLETQLEAGRDRTKKLREEFLKMQDNSKTTTAQLNNMYGKLKDSEAAEAALESRLKEVNSELTEQAEASRKSQNELDKLQQESRELEAQTEKLNSELRLQESQMGESASEAEKAAFAQEKFGKQTELVEKQISNLEKQLEIVKREYGENSIEANKMEAELNEAKLAFNNLNSEMSNTKASADVAQDGMGRVTDLLQSQVYMQASQQLAQISDKLIDLGKEAVESAANFRAADAQFEQVFGNMEDKARETVAAMGEQMGILPRRLEPGYAAISSQLMSLGVESEKALQLSEQALFSAADAAAFYDISLEDAQERVQSFIKGNMSAAESIGIFATAGNMATYAIQNGFVEATAEQERFAEKMGISIEKAQRKVSEAQQKYGADSLQARDATQKLNEELEKQEKGLNLKSKWDELSEAQKQAVRVDYIKSMQEMGKVTGQAAREMDGYENVMGNLSSAVDEIKAAIGDELLTILVELAQMVIPLLSGFAEWFSNLSPAIKQFVVAFGAVIAVVGTLMPIIATLGAAAAAAGVSIGALIVGTILPAIGIVAAVAAGIAALILVIKNWGAISDWLSEKWQQFLSFFSEKMDQTGNKIVETYQNIKNAVIAKIIELWQGLVEKFEEIKMATIQKWTEIKESVISRFTEAKETAIGIAEEIWQGIVEKFEDIYSSTKEKFGKIRDAIVDPIIKAKDKVKETLEAIKDFFVNMKMPKFGLKTSSKTILGKEISYPSGIDIKWNAKGGIFNKPTIFGQSGGQLQGAGEAGPEAVLPLTEENLAAIGKGIPGNGVHIEQHNHFGKVDYNNPSERFKMDRDLQESAKQAIIDAGGIPT